MEGIFSVASSSTSTTYGNVACSIKELILSKFPYDFFKYVNISSELAFRNIRRQFGRNTNNEFAKRRKPYLVIKPIYSVSSSDQFLFDIPLTKNFDNIECGLDKRYLFNIFKDPDNGYNLKFKMNRDKIDFDITITLSTLHAQIDIYKAMLNQFVWERPYVHRTALEVMIPRSMIRQIQELSGIGDQESCVPITMNYLNRISNFPITYKMKNVTGRDEYFMYYNHDMIVNFTDLNIEEGNKKNMVDDYYNITFRVSAEFNLPGLFLLEGNSDKLLTIKADLVDRDVYNDANTEFIPLFTLNNFYSRYPSFIDGYRLYTSSIFNVEDTRNKRDTLDISPLFEPDIKRVIGENVSFGVRIEPILKIIILKNNEELEKDKDWDIDYHNLIVGIMNLDKDATYRILIYLNNIQLNERLVELSEEKKKDMPKL